MSSYKVCETKMKDLDLLVKALEKKEPAWKGKILVDKSNKLVPYGYEGNDRSKAKKDDRHYCPLASAVVPGSAAAKRGVPQVVPGASNDIPIVLSAKGTYSVYLSDYDRGQGWNESWLSEVEKIYAEIGGIPVAQQIVNDMKAELAAAGNNVEVVQSLAKHAATFAGTEGIGANAIVEAVKITGKKTQVTGAQLNWLKENKRDAYNALMSKFKSVRAV